MPIVSFAIQLGRSLALAPAIFYLMAIHLASAEASAAPPVPDKPSASCQATIDDKCYVTDDFVLSASVPGADHYRVCRSDDTHGWGGCREIVTMYSGPNVLISGDHLPSDGTRRAYYFSACDASGDCTAWGDNEEVYVSMDRQPPTRALQAISYPSPSDDGVEGIQLTLRATDDGSGVQEVRALINPHGHEEALRGYLSWRDESMGYLWSADQVPCSGGGFASKHPNRFNPSSITLVDCDSSSNAVGQTVTFTIELSSHSGGPESIEDAFFWARDFTLNGTSWQSLEPGFVVDHPDPRLGEHFGYSGINDPSQLAEVENKGIPVNLAFLMYLNDESHPHYWRTVDTGRILQYYRARGVRAVAVFENFLFEIITDPDSPCFNRQTYRLRPDWLSRLQEFRALHGSWLNPEDVTMILMQSEINDRCAIMSEVMEASEAVRRYFPDIPLTLGYGATHDPNGARASTPPPAALPDIFDGVGIFSYNLFNVNHPSDPRNATDRFYNPDFPEDPSTVYGDLLTKLKPHQKVHLIFDAHFSPTHQDLGWNAQDLALVALNYADFMASRPEIVTLVGFHWRKSGGALGMNQLPQLTVDTNIAIACSYFPITCDSPGRL